MSTERDGQEIKQVLPLGWRFSRSITPSAGSSIVVFDPSGHYLAIGGLHLIEIWSSETGEKLRTIKAHDGKVLSIAFDQKSRVLASSGTDQVVRLWDLESGKLVSILPVPRGPVRALSFHPVLPLLAAGTSGGTISIWDVHDFQLPTILKPWRTVAG